MGSINSFSSFFFSKLTKIDLSLFREGICLPTRLQALTVGTRLLADTYTTRDDVVTRSFTHSMAVQGNQETECRGKKEMDAQ